MRQASSDATASGTSVSRPPTRSVRGRERNIKGGQARPGVDDSNGEAKVPVCEPLAVLVNLDEEEPEPAAVPVCEMLGVPDKLEEAELEILEEPDSLGVPVCEELPVPVRACVPDDDDDSGACISQQKWNAAAQL